MTMSLPPHVYHLAEAANATSILRHGLMPTSELLKRGGLSADERSRLSRTQRPLNTTLPDGAVIRHQRPMPAAALANCLVGMTPGEWYALLNSRVFFWCDVDRLNRLRKACEPDPQVLYTVDTAALLSAYNPLVSLTPINSGNARRRPARRGAATFVPYRVWLESGWASEAAALGTRPRPRAHRPVELTVAGPLPDFARFVVATHPLAPGELFAG